MYLLFLLTLGINAQNYEEKFYKDATDIPKGFGVHTDVGYSDYLVELHSSEVDSAIDYDVLEFTLGASYVYDKWLWGVYGKFLVDEFKSNMYVVTTQSPLDDKANISKDEFALYVNYRLKESANDVWKINLIYRYASLDATDSYVSFYNYASHFQYQTDGLALSLVYSQMLNERDSWFINSGLVYSRAKVEMSESINHNLQDSFVNDSTKAIGVKLSAGYNYKVTNKLFLNIRIDAWRHNFNKLSVTSRVGDSLPKAELKEQSFSTYTGLTWRF